MTKSFSEKQKLTQTFMETFGYPIDYRIPEWTPVIQPVERDGIEVKELGSIQEIYEFLKDFSGRVSGLNLVKSPGIEHHLGLSIDGKPAILFKYIFVAKIDPSELMMGKNNCRGACFLADDQIEISEFYEYIANSGRLLVQYHLSQDKNQTKWTEPSSEGVKEKEEWIATLSPEDDIDQVARMVATTCAYLLSGEWKNEDWLRVVLPERAEAMLGYERMAHQEKFKDKAGFAIILRHLEKEVYAKFGGQHAKNHKELGCIARKNAETIIEILKASINIMTEYYDIDEIQTTIGDPGATLAQFMIDESALVWLPTPQTDTVNIADRLAILPQLP